MAQIPHQEGVTIGQWQLIKHSMLSGGAESSIVLWDLEAVENTTKSFVNRPAGVVRPYETLGLLHMNLC